jgi:hypothetical protein
VDGNMIEVHIEGVDDRLRDFCIGNVPKDLVDDFFDQLERLLSRRAEDLGMYLLSNRRGGCGIEGIRVDDSAWDALEPSFFMDPAEAYGLAQAKARKQRRAVAARK